MQMTYMVLPLDPARQSPEHAYFIAAGGDRVAARAAIAAATALRQRGIECANVCADSPPHYKARGVEPPSRLRDRTSDAAASHQTSPRIAIQNTGVLVKTIKTDRLIIRNFRLGDAEALFAYLEQPAVSCFFSLKLSDIKAAEAEALRRSAGDEYLAVSLKETDDLIGDIFVHPDPIGPEDGEQSKQPDTISIGWNFNLRFGGQGYAFEAAQAMFAELFANQNVRRIYAYVEEDNISSRRLCEKLGMRKEGLFLEYVSFQNDQAGNPIYENTMQFAILKHEWEQH